jgi:hypothetical protein
MISLFDTGFLYYLFDDRAKAPKDRQGKPTVDRVQERIDYLVQSISQGRGKIIIPSPALAEFMLLAWDKYSEYLTIIRRKAVFEVAGFDDPEAVELVEHWRKHGDGKKPKAGAAETWAKVKYDRQIIAIALTRRVECVYSTDKDLHRYANQIGMKSCGLADLPLPPPRQLHLVEQPLPDSPTQGEEPDERNRESTEAGDPPESVVVIEAVRPLD